VPVSASAVSSAWASWIPRPVARSSTEPARDDGEIRSSESDACPTPRTWSGRVSVCTIDPSESEKIHRVPYPVSTGRRSTRARRVVPGDSGGANALPEPAGEAVLDGHRTERPGHLTGRQLITQDEQPDKQTRRARLPGVAADRRRIRAVESRHRGPSQRRLEPGDGEVVLAQMGGEGRGE